MSIRDLRDFLVYGPFRAAFAGGPPRHFHEKRRCRSHHEDEPRDHTRGHWRHWQRWRGWEEAGPRARTKVTPARVILKQAPKRVNDSLKARP